MAGTLNFLLQIRDQASQAIRSVGGSFQNLGQAAGAAGAAFGRLTQAQNVHAASTHNLHQVVLRTTVAITDLAAANAVLTGSLEAFRGYEKSMSVVERVTNNTSAAMTEFQGKFLSLSQSIGGVPIDRLGVIAGQAAQLGISGTENILKFTGTMAKLETILPELGDQAPKLIARLLAVSGEGVESVETFASMLVRTGKDANSSEQAILHLTSVLAQSTAQFKLGSAVLLGLGTSFSEMGLQPELASTAVSRALQQLNEASLNNTEGMRRLSAMTGYTAEEFQKLLRNDPSEAFLIFTDVLNALNKDGRSTLGFLTSLNLQASENIRVLGTVSENADNVRKSIATMRSEQAKPGALNQEFAVAMKTLDYTIKETQSSWERFKIATGAALAPLATKALQALTFSLNLVTAGFRAAPAWAQQVLAWSAVAIPAILGVIVALSSLRLALAISAYSGLNTALLLTTRTIVGLGAAIAGLVGRLAFFAVLKPILLAIGGVVGVVVGAVGAIPAAIVAAVAVVVASGAAIYKYWDDLKTFFTEGFVDGIVKAFTAGIAKMSALYEGFIDWIMMKGAKPELEIDAKVKLNDSVRPSQAGGVDTKAETELTPANLQQIKQLDQQSKLLEQIKAQEIALDQLRKLAVTDPQYRSPDELARLQGLVALEKARLDSVAVRVKALNEETQSAFAYTAEQKNALEVIQNQRQELEKRGALTTKQLDDIKKATEALQSARQNSALAELNTQLNNSLATSKAVTREQQLQVEIQQKIADFVRTNGQISTTQANTIRRAMEQTKQNDNLRSTMERLDPVTAATRDYESEVRVLNQGLAQGSINATQYQQALAALNRTTLEQRDPIGAQVKGMREQITLARISGDYAEADRQTQATINDLRSKGVGITRDQAQAMSDYNRALSDAQMSQTGGFEGWSKAVGSFRQGMLDVQRDFTSELSRGMVGVISGEGKDAVAGMFKNMGQKFLQVGVDQAIKGIGESTGVFSFLSGKMGTDSKSAIDKANEAANKLDVTRSMQAQSVVVTAASVVVNGQTLTGIGLDQAKTYVNNGTITPGQTGPLASVAPGVAAITAGAYRGPPPVLAGTSVERTTALLKQYEGFQPTAKFDVNAMRLGYGSDTKTDASGRVSRVVTGDSVTRAEADLDLARRIPQFQDRVRQQVGYDRFDSFNPDTQAALSSVAYNYGKIPSRIVGTVRNGSQDEIANAVQGLSGDNDGINAGRRAQEAQIIRNSQQQVEQARQTAQQVSAAQAQGGQAQVQAVQQAQQQIATTAQTSGASMQQLTQSVEQAGTAAQSAAPKVQQAAQTQAQATAETSAFAGGVGSLTGSFASAQLGLGQFGGALSTMLSNLFSSATSGSGGIGGIFASLFGGATGTAAVAHSGWGSVGSGMPGNGYRTVNPADFVHARRFHSGTSGGNDNEYKAILQKGERVLTERDAKRTDNVLRGVDNMSSQGGRPASQQNVKQTVSNNMNMGDTTITVQGSSGDKQMDAEHLANLEKLLDDRTDRAMTAWMQNQQRPGGMLAQAGARRR